MNRVSRLVIALGAALAASAAWAEIAAAQARRAPEASAPATARASAPMDITGHWVALITDDWVYRMITPAKGDVSYIPLNAEGRRAPDPRPPRRDDPRR